MDKYLGRETVRGVSTFHFSNSLDKTQAKAMAGELLDAVFSQANLQASSSPADLAQAKASATKVFGSIIDGLRISDFETWIGADLQLHKVKFTSNAPSLTSLASASANNPALAQDPAKAADNILSAMTFDGAISVNQEYYDFGKTQAVTAPANALDLAQKLKEQSAKNSQLAVPGQK
jgi:pyrroline-5-carboxylate reductase